MAPFDIGGLTQPARIAVSKSTVSATLVGQSGGNYTYDVVFHVRVQNTGLQDLTSVNVFDDLGSTFAGAGSWSLTSKQLLAAQSNFSEGGSMVVNPGYTGIPPNHNLVNTTVTRRLNYDDTLPVSDQGDFATFEIVARHTTTCPASRINAVTANGTPLLSGSQVSANASSNVGCTPTAVGAFELRADSGPSSADLALMAAIVTSVLVGLTWSLRRNRPTSPILAWSPSSFDRIVANRRRSSTTMAARPCPLSEERPCTERTSAGSSLPARSRTSSRRACSGWR